MKRRISISLIILLFSVLQVNDSCKKEARIEGCTDRDSKNFDPTANVENGNCEYEGQMIIWFDNSIANTLKGFGALALTYYLGGQNIGYNTVNDFWSLAPECGRSGTITALRDLGKDKTQVDTLSVKDQTGFEFWHEAVTFTANNCVIHRLLSPRYKFPNYK
jgi:hypothetical protein